jgi:ABC-type phosphate transport system substrate-binding protein
MIILRRLVFCCLFSPVLLLQQLQLHVVLVNGQQDEYQCQRFSGSLSVAGASSVQRLMDAWVEAYQRTCDDGSTVIDDSSVFRIEGGGVGRGAQRVCGTAPSLIGDTTNNSNGDDEGETGSDDVDIAGLTRSLNSGEATVQEGTDYLYDCVRSTRSIIQVRRKLWIRVRVKLASSYVPVVHLYMAFSILTLCSLTMMQQVEVASEGISIATKLDGDAATCISILGGLTTDQLRWIFSSYDDAQLQQAGWDPTSVPNSDSNLDTHLWSEINSLCPSTEIQIAIPETTSILFRELIFSGVDEDFARHRNNTLSDATSNKELVDFIVDHGNAMTYFELAYVIDDIDQEVISLAPIFNEDEQEYLKPSAASFEANTYPLLRRLYLAMLNEESSLESTRVLLDFGLFSSQGIDATKSVGLWPIHRWEKILMATRAQTANGVPLADIQDYCLIPVEADAANADAAEIHIAGSSTVYPVAQIWSSIYQIGCPWTTFVVEGGGSSVGAGRVCGDPERGTPVDIGDMSRPWKDSEAEVSPNGYLYQCLAPGDPSRAAVQIDVAIDGLTVAGT